MEARKKEMEERIARIRERERRERLAAKKENGRVIKRRVNSVTGERVTFRKKNN